jgi:hypothetical protein
MNTYNSEYVTAWAELVMARLSWHDMKSTRIIISRGCSGFLVPSQSLVVRATLTYEALQVRRGRQRHVAQLGA